MEAQSEAFKLAQQDQALQPMVPELYYYLLKGLAWSGDRQTLQGIFKEDKLDFYHPGQNAPAAALAHLVASTYLVSAEKYHAAENEYSIAVLSLLLIDPQNRYAISKVLIALLESLILQQDIVGALQLVRLADPYLTNNLNHEGPYWANYAYLATQLVAISRRDKNLVPALIESSRLNERQDINDGIKGYRLGTNNDLQTLILLLDGKDKEAIATHARHPFQPQREAIIQRGRFENIQEFYFALADVVVENVAGDRKEDNWRPLFSSEFPANWQLTAALRKNLESYRKFALGIIESNVSKAEAAQLFQVAARDRIDLFEDVLKKRFEGFQLPTVMDALVVRAGLASLATTDDNRDTNLMLRGSEVLLRTLRHQISDFSILIGAQDSERARATARSYYLLQQQKRHWEFEQIGELLNAKPGRDLGAIINTYNQLVTSISQLKERLSNNPQYNATVGYPEVTQVQQALNKDEVFVSFVPTFRGLGRLCISRDKIHSTFSNVDNREQLELDIKLLKLALTADHAPNIALDSQYPAASAVRLHRLLFDGLDACLQKGSHINIAVPDELLGIPIAALLSEMPPVSGDGYDLSSAQWMGNDFSFSLFVSARHFLGSIKSAARQGISGSYLGVGNPQLAEHKATSLGLSDAKSAPRSFRAEALRNLSELPETSEELQAAKEQFPGGEVLVGNEASEEKVRSRDLGKYDIIHFATHGLLTGDIDGLTEPALVLTPTDFNDSFDDGLLVASEITRFALGARLIVLSACNTAKIDVSAATVGATDLQAAFSVAGAPALVATLWTVETKTARDIVTKLFSYWRMQSEKSASTALALATREYLRGADKAHQHPRFWAPFVVLGYGHQIRTRPIEGARDLSAVRPVSEGPGEVLDVKPFQDGLTASIQGDWNGKKMASILKDAKRPSVPEVKTYDTGAGYMLPVGDHLYAIGYRSSEQSFPVLRKIAKDRSIIWEKSFESFRDYMFLDARYVANSIVTVLTSIGSAKPVLLVKLDLEGNELGRIQVDAPPTNLLLGRKALLGGASANEILVVVNSQEEPKLTSTTSSKLNRLGVGSWCPGAARASIYSLNAASMVIARLTAIESYQAFKIERLGNRILLGGATRDACSNTTSALLYELSPKGSAKQVWVDDDPFTSAVQSFDEKSGNIVMLIKRQRPLGIRLLTSKDPSSFDASKRWGDDGAELWEFSVVALTPEGKELWHYDSSFGLSVFMQGITTWKDQFVLYGSVGGRPAISQY